MTGFSACSPSMRSDSSYLNKVMRPLGWAGEVKKDEIATEEALRLNASYYFLLGQELSGAGKVDEALQAYERVRSLDEGSARVHYVLAEEYLKKGLTKEGVAMVRKAIELDPKNRAARLLLANLHLTAKKYGEATTLLEALVAENPDDEEVMLNLTLVELEQKRYDPAYKRLMAYLKRDPESALSYFYVGRIEQERGKKKEALAAYLKAVDLRAGFVQAGTYLGFLQEEMGDRKGAIETFSWLSEQTDGPRYHKKLGQLYLDDENYPKSLEAFLNYERVDPLDLNNKVKVGLLLLELKRPLEAEVKFRDVLKGSPDSENVRFYLASVYEDLKRFPEAIKEFEKIPATSKLSFEAIKKRAWIYQKLDKVDDGWKILDKELKASEGDVAHYEEVAENAVSYLATAKRFDQAEKFLTSVLERNPTSEKLLYSQGLLFEKRGRFDDAVASMQKILSKKPDHAAALNFVGFLWADQGQRLEEAEGYIRKALKSRPKDAYITDSLGWVLYRRGKYPDALRELELAFKAAPEESVISEHIGDVLVKMGRLAEAKRHYEKALELGPEKDTDRTKLEEKLAKLSQDLETRCHAVGEKNDCGRDTDPTHGLREPRTPASSRKN